MAAAAETPGMASAVAGKKRAGFSSVARQRRMGPAPFASFEQDLSDELESPEERRPQLPDIKEDCTPGGGGGGESPVVTSAGASSLAGSASVAGSAGGLHTPSTPRIDISRASSSSHHESGESRDSTPERELFAGTGGLGFKEEGTAELRSSTEELDFHEDAGERERRRERLQRRKEKGRGQPVFKYELEAQSEKERKDSACSLPVSGRTSRLSSIGSAASGASSAASALSVGSRGAMSASAMSANSRSPSPHRMLLETSFCGSRPIPTQSIDLDSPCKHETESLEKVLLSRQTDPTRVVIAVECTPTEPVPPAPSQHHDKPKKKPPILKQQNSSKPPPSTAAVTVTTASVVATTPQPATTKQEVKQEIQQDIQSDIQQEKLQEKPVTLNFAESGTKVVQSFSEIIHSSPDVHQEPESPSKAQNSCTSPSENEISVAPVQIVSDSSTNEKSLSDTPPSASPQLSRQNILKKTVEEATHNERGSRTPSPSTSRKSSFTNLFRRTDSPLSPESPTAKRKNVFTTRLKEASDGLRDRSRSRSKSSERVSLEGKTKKDSKNKSVFSALFKKKKRSGSSSEEVQSPLEALSPEEGARLTDVIGNVEFTFASEPLDSSVIAGGIVSKDEVKEKRLEKVPIPPKEHPPMREEVRVTQVNSTIAETEHHSSDSEMDRSRDESMSKSLETRDEREKPGEEVDHERKGLVLQDSFEDELPYIPTTLPQERSVAVPIVPVRQRLCPEVCPIERPRSTTPINPANLEEFVMAGPSSGTGAPERIRISLPREDSLSNSHSTSRSLKSPRRVPQVRSWVEFAEQSIQGSGIEGRRPSVSSPASPPPLPPRTSPPQQSNTPPPPPAKSWVNFEEIPERRKPPKKIQTIPSRGSILDGVTDGSPNVTYSYVNPEDCRGWGEQEDEDGASRFGVPSRCECHEPRHHHHAAPLNGGQQWGHQEHQQVSSTTLNRTAAAVSSSSQVRLDVDSNSSTSATDRNSIMSDSSYEYTASPYQLPQDNSSAGGLKPMKPFGMDLDVHSNRSSIISQDELPTPESPTNGGKLLPLQNE